MNILAVDNERHALEILKSAILEAAPEAELRGFTHASEAVAELRENGFLPDVAFLDIEMPGITGLDLAKIIQDNYPAANIVFVTGYSQYALDAMEQRSSGYVMKPVTKEKVIEELKNLRNPLQRTEPPRPVRVRCFGNFELFVHGEPVSFLRSKSKELLAYLVDRRGAACTSAEQAAILWDGMPYDRARQKQLSVIRADLVKSLTQAGAQSILVRSRDSLAVDPESFDCDYYMALAGDSDAIRQFHGAFMEPYVWAEFTKGNLTFRYGVFI